MYKFDTNNTDHISIELWFQVWEKQVQKKDFESAKRLFEATCTKKGPLFTETIVRTAMFVNSTSCIRPRK